MIKLHNREARYFYLEQASFLFIMPNFMANILMYGKHFI